MESRSRSRLGWAAGGILALMLAVAGGAVVFWPETAPPAEAQTAAKPARPLTPFEQSVEVLSAQAEALMRGDEKAWLAAVDPSQPKLQAKYRAIYRNLRALDVSKVEYHTYRREAGTKSVVTVYAHLAYCFSAGACPAWRTDVRSGPPRIKYDLDLKQIDGKYVISAVEDDPAHQWNLLQPAPWEDEELTVARGRRVTVAGSPGQAKRVPEVLALAEKAAEVSDRFAAYLDNPQPRYRIYLADKKAWKRWYGGVDQDWIVGYALPLNSAGVDVVLDIGELPHRAELAQVVQHELGHVATLGGTGTRDIDDDDWLTEGIAEYISVYPRPAKSSISRFRVQRAFQSGKPPKTIASKPLRSDADDRTVDTFYAMGHFATDCMAKQYGERKLFEFVNQVLRAGAKPDEASRSVYGKPFAAVDKACLTWVKKQI